MQRQSKEIQIIFESHYHDDIIEILKALNSLSLNNSFNDTLNLLIKKTFITDNDYRMVSQIKALYKK